MRAAEQHLLAQIERLATTTKASPGAGIETVGQLVRIALPHIRREERERVRKDCLRVADAADAADVRGGPAQALREGWHYHGDTLYTAPCIGGVPEDPL